MNQNKIERHVAEWEAIKDMLRETRERYALL
jgi:hypothetical protein